MTKYAQSTLLMRTALKSLTTSSRSESKTQSQLNDSNSQNLKRRRVYSNTIVRAFLLLLGLASMCRASSDHQVDHDEKQNSEKHHDLENEKSFEDLKKEILHVDVRRFVIHPDEVVQNIATIKKKLSNTRRKMANKGEKINKSVQAQYGEYLEQQFQKKLEELKELFQDKEAMAKQLMKQGEKFKKLTKQEQLDIQRYIGRVSDLQERDFTLADSYWGTRNDDEKMFKVKKVGSGIRQGHLNCLAIGLSHVTSGFTMAYKGKTERFPFIKKAQAMGIIPQEGECGTKTGGNGEEYDLTPQDRADTLAGLMDVGRGETKFDDADERITEAMKEIVLSKEEFKKRVAQICQEYYDWSNEKRIPQEEMDLILSNARYEYTSNMCVSYKNNLYPCIVAQNGEFKEFLNIESKKVPDELLNAEIPKDIITSTQCYYPTTRVEDAGVTYRMARILGMILKEDLDIITLVELDCYDFFAKVLKRFGYVGTFQEKVGQKGKDNAGHAYWIERDGAAIFWKKDKFDVEKPKLSCMVKKVTSAESGKGKVDKNPKWKNPARNNALNKNVHNNIYLGACHGKQVAIDVTFKCKTGGEKFSIITGHLKSGSLVKDLEKKAQIMEFVGERFKYLNYQNNGNAIISGDLNTPPDGPLKTLQHLQKIILGDTAKLTRIQQDTEELLTAEDSDRKIQVEIGNKNYSCQVNRKLENDQYEITIDDKAFKQKVKTRTVALTDLYVSMSIYFNKALEKHVIKYEKKSRCCKLHNVYPIEYLTKFSLRLGGSQPHKLKWCAEVEDYLMCAEGMTAQFLMWFGQAVQSYTAFAPTEEFPKYDYFKSRGGAPNGRLPSDHIMIATIWEFKKLTPGAQKRLSEHSRTESRITRVRRVKSSIAKGTPRRGSVSSRRGSVHVPYAECKPHMKNRRAVGYQPFSQPVREKIKQDSAQRAARYCEASFKKVHEMDVLEEEDEEVDEINGRRRLMERLQNN